MSEPYYPRLSPIKTGLAGNCPRCGRGKLFCGLSDCRAALLELRSAFRLRRCRRRRRLVRHAVRLLCRRRLDPGNRGRLFAALLGSCADRHPVLIILPLILLRPAKGMLVCQQYMTKAQEGRVDVG